MSTSQYKSIQRADKAPKQVALYLQRILQVHINGIYAGVLQDTSSIWSFSYPRNWVRNAERSAIAPEIPLQTAPIVDSITFRPVQRYFEGLLPG